MACTVVVSGIPMVTVKLVKGVMVLNAT